MKELPYIVNSIQPNYDAQKWCISYIGPRWSVLARTGEWTCFWRGPEKRYQWYFKNENDAIMFALMWL